MNKLFLSSILAFHTLFLCADNQTLDITPVLPPTDLPFSVSIELTDLSVPNGWHSGAMATKGGKCLLVAGRTNGLHGFDDNPNVNNFPPQAQNTVFFVIDFKNQVVYSRSMMDPTSGLTQEQVDTLSVTSPQFYQIKSTLYITGGYGINTATGNMETKSTLTAVDIAGMMDWVINAKGSAVKNIRQTTNPLLQVTGGDMYQVSSHLPTLLIFGQNFTGLYRDNSNGQYTQQVRSFRILDDGKQLNVIASQNQPFINPAFRRRDLNVVPIIQPGTQKQAFVALSGVFTPSGGVWTVPVEISADGSTFMANPLDPATFKQAMNNYVCASAGLFSNKTEDMYVLLFGGITFGFFQNGQFDTDPEIPFTSEVTTVRIDDRGNYSQYIMANQYPTIPSTFSNPGNPLLFGAGGMFVLAQGVPTFRNGVISLDKILKKPRVIGYIVGGIQSTLPNTNTRADSAASPYIFQVTVQPN